MFHVEVILGVFTPGPNVLVRETDAGLALPGEILTEQESTLDVAARLLRESTGLEPRIGGVGWVDLVGVGVADSINRTRLMTERGQPERVIAIPYGCLVPYSQVVVGEGLIWVPLTECLSRLCVEDHKQILFAICQRV